MRYRQRLAWVMILFMVLAVMLTSSYSILQIRNYLLSIGLSSPIHTIRWIIYTGMFITIALVVVVGAVHARAMARPVQQLSNMAKALSAGKWEAMPELHRKDELGEVARSLVAAAKALQEDNLRLQTLHTLQQQFHQDIAHEVRSPLHTLLTSLEMLEVSGPLLANQMPYLQLAKTQTERLSRLFNNLLTLQRAEADPHFTHLEPVALQPLVQRLAPSYSLACEAAGLELQLMGEPAAVLADPHHLEHVLDNLLSNALKNTPQGCIRLGHCVNSTSVELYVEDTGVGIAPEHIPQLTHRFYRVDTARSRDSGGAGLGLAIVQRLLQAMGSTLMLTSQPGVGTRASFVLPIAAQ